MIANDTNRVRGAVLGLSQDGACTDSFENFRENSLKGDLLNNITLNPPLFSLVNSFKGIDLCKGEWHVFKLFRYPSYLKKLCIYFYIGFNARKVGWLSCWRRLLVKESCGFLLDRKAWDISSGTRPCFLLALGFATCVSIKTMPTTLSEALAASEASFITI